MPWIQNVPMIAAKVGDHLGMGTGCVLIQIVDPAYEFPKTKYQFEQVHQFEFLDIDEHSPEWSNQYEFAITDDQAESIVKILRDAMDADLNVVVHCHAGVCRSGAVAEVGTMMGFEDSKSLRIPNVLVKYKLMKQLGWTYD